MDTANIKSSNAIFIAKDFVDNAPQSPIIKRAQLEQASNSEQKEKQNTVQQKLVAGNEEVFQRAESFKQSTSYDDNPNLRIRKELELYQSIDTQEKREDITQLLGVDIYAWYAGIAIANKPPFIQTEHANKPLNQAKHFEFVKKSIVTI